MSTWRGPGGLARIQRSRVRSPDPALFFARVVVQDLGAVALYEIEAAFAQLDVSRDDTIDAALDLVFVEQGRLTIESEFGSLRVDAGMIAAAPTWIAHHLEVAEHTAGLAARLDRTAVETVLPQPIQRPLVLEQQTALRRAVRAFAREVLLTDDDVSAIESYGTQQLLVEMAGVLLSDTFGVGLSKGTPTAALRDRAIAYIAQTRANVDLTARDITRACRSRFGDCRRHSPRRAHRFLRSFVASGRSLPTICSSTAATTCFRSMTSRSSRDSGRQSV